MKETVGTNKKIDLSQYKELIDTICKIEYKKVSALGLLEFSEVINIGNYTVYYLIKNSNNKSAFNNAYISNAIKWAIRNEVRRRYKWYLMKNQETIGNCFSQLLSIDDVETDSTPMLKDSSATPDINSQNIELRKAIERAIEKLPEKEREIIKAKFFYNKKLKEISVEFNLSPSRISRILQFSLEKLKKDLIKQECQ